MSSITENSTAPSASIRASVVVPVYNPGPALDDLLDSLARQTMPITDFEVLLCDDGSDEPTRARLDRAAQEHANVRVLHLPHSGWPGAPRNKGIDAARGTYIHFVDQDDRLFEAALEKICDYADLHDSDVVVGREVGIGRRLPSRIFRRDIPQAVLGTDPLLEMLTPHKLFRTSFLRTAGIRFPEGKVRLEDHLFVMQAYFQARTISILASEPCYAWVKHPGSASASRIDPVTYFPHLETVLDLVEAHTEPGALRNRLLRHWLRGKVLQRLSGAQMRKYPAEYRENLLDVLVPLVRRRFPVEVDGGLAFPHRIRAALLRADRREDLLKLAVFEADMTCRATVTSARWSRGGGLHLTVRIDIRSGGTDALVLDAERSESAALVSLPITAGDGLPPRLLVPGRELANDTLSILLDDIVGEPRPLAQKHPANLTSVRFAIDPLQVFGPEDASRGGALSVKVRRAGWTFQVPLTATQDILDRAGRSPLLAGRPCVLLATDEGIELRRDAGRGGLRDTAGRAVRQLRRRAQRR